MLPPVFPLLSASALIEPLLGTGLACRVKSYGKAPPNYARPYVTWQVISGEPHNTLADIPGSDRTVSQIDIWADTDAQAREVLDAVRYELEQAGQVVSYNVSEIDPDTQLFRISFDWEHVRIRPEYPPIPR